jgi:adenine-specific DNA-methyltransferase
MAKGRKTLANSSNQKLIEQYNHVDKDWLNNPYFVLVSKMTDEDYSQKKKKYSCDPHLDPQLQWVGNAEFTSLEVPVV